MLLLVGLVGSLFVGMYAYRQHVAIQNLREFGVEIRPNASQVVPKWSRRWIGEQRLEPLGKVQNLDLSGVTLTDTDMAYVRGLNGLEWALGSDNYCEGFAVGRHARHGWRSRPSKAIEAPRSPVTEPNRSNWSRTEIFNRTPLAAPP